MAPLVFTGALMPKKKQELQDIAIALRISETGTKDDIMSRIKRHLELNPELEDDSSFAGLYGNRRKRSVQPQIPTVTSLPKPISRDSRGRRVVPLDPIRESTPVNDLRDVSMFLKNPVSPFDNTPEQSPRREVAITPSSLPPLPSSPSKSIMEHLPTSQDVEVLTNKIKDNELLRNSVEMLEQFREFLSNSKNVWSATAVMEYIYIIYIVIPWKTGSLLLFQLKETPISLPYFYPPLSIFQSYAFWMVLLHWALPTLILPAVAGSLISFAPKPASSPALPDTPYATAPFDPLTAAIIRVAVQANYPYASLSVQGADVLGWNWRVWNAAVGLLFAFSEKLGGSPQVTAQILQDEQRKERLHLEGSPVSITDSPPKRRRALVASTQLSDEVD